jgi:hypothetical protein
MLSSPRSTRFKITAYEGNTVDVTLDIRAFLGEREINLVYASNLYLNIERPRSSIEQQFVADKNHADADWENGIVVFTLTDTALSTVGSFPMSVIGAVGVETITFATGHLEVQDRPGYPHPA